MARKDASIALACSISKLVEHTRWQRTQRLCFTPNNNRCPTLSNTVQHMSNTTLSNTVQHKQHCPTQTTITPTNTDHHSHQYTTNTQAKHNPHTANTTSLASEAEPSAARRRLLHKAGAGTFLHKPGWRPGRPALSAPASASPACLSLSGSAQLLWLAGARAQRHR